MGSGVPGERRVSYMVLNSFSVSISFCSLDDESLPEWVVFSVSVCTGEAGGRVDCFLVSLLWASACSMSDSIETSIMVASRT